MMICLKIFENCWNIFMEIMLKFDEILYMYIVGNIPCNYACSFGTNVINLSCLVLVYNICELFSLYSLMVN